MTETKSETSKLCSMLSTEAHKHCRGCTGCTCHEQGSFGGQAGSQRRRPHSFPREDWKHGARPKWWRDSKTSRKREDQLLGLI